MTSYSSFSFCPFFTPFANFLLLWGQGKTFGAKRCDEKWFWSYRLSKHWDMAQLEFRELFYSQISVLFYCSIKLAIYFQIDVKIREFSPVLFFRSVWIWISLESMTSQTLSNLTQFKRWQEKWNRWKCYDFEFNLKLNSWINTAVNLRYYGFKTWI